MASVEDEGTTTFSYIDGLNIGLRKVESPTSVVHLEYDHNSVPPVPSNKWTRFVCISDSHSRTYPVPNGDVLIHGGDLTDLGTLEEFERTVNWLCELPHPIKLIIAGNHDLSLHTGWYEKNYNRWHGVQREDTDAILNLLRSPKAIAAGIVYLQDQLHSFRTRPDGRLWTIYGSPWSPYFYDWAFNYHRGKDAEDIVARFPQTDILVTHGPPFKIFDATLSKQYVGCEALTKRLHELRPLLHVFGHIHEAHGAGIYEWPARDELQRGSLETVFVNAANWPMGPRAWRDDTKVPFGGPGFQPVIVDIHAL